MLSADHCARCTDERVTGFRLDAVIRSVAQYMDAGREPEGRARRSRRDQRRQIAAGRDANRVKLAASRDRGAVRIRRSGPAQPMERCRRERRAQPWPSAPVAASGTSATAVVPRRGQAGQPLLRRRPLGAKSTCALPRPSPPGLASRLWPGGDAVVLNRGANLKRPRSGRWPASTPRSWLDARRIAIPQT